jgi:hypothetical protein
VEAATAMIQESTVQTEMKLAKIAQVTGDVAKTTETIVTHVNHARQELLETILDGKITIARLQDTPENREAVIRAQKNLDQHMEGQGVVNEAAGKPPVSPGAHMPHLLHPHLENLK